MALGVGKLMQKLEWKVEEVGRMLLVRPRRELSEMDEIVHRRVAQIHSV